MYFANPVLIFFRVYLHIQVIVEGNIGSGKTSFIEHFTKRYPLTVYPLLEPVEKWRDVRGQNMLALMYDDPRRWSFPFQQYVQLTMAELHKQQPDQINTAEVNDFTVKLMERSLYSARHCFVENLAAAKMISEPEMIIYDEWYKFLTAQEFSKVDLIVYLKSDPETCHQRIRQRCRPEERQIPLSYLEQLHEHHEKWLNDEHSINKLPAPVLTISNNHTDISLLNGICEKAKPYLFGEKRISCSHAL